jgi:adenine-specific DNA-methyltransferase
VYTPQPLAAFIVGRLPPEASEEGVWLDPACGEGALLEAIVDRLAEHVAVADLPDAVAARVFGMDIDPEACVLARRRLVSAVEAHGGRFADPERYDTNIRCADFLQLDPIVERRPTWIVANPPYVSATHLSGARKLDLTRRFTSAWGRLDLYGVFLEHALALLTPGGAASFITPDKWLTSDSSRSLRALVGRHRVRSIARFDRHDLFPGVATVPCVAVVVREPPVAGSVVVQWYDADADGHPIATGTREQLHIPAGGAPWHAVSASASLAGGVPLGDLVERISVGLATGYNRCFVIDDAAARAIEPELLRPVLRGRDVLDDDLAEAGLWLLLPYRFDDAGRALGPIDLTDFPGARAHLEAHRPALEQRHCVRIWRKRWYELHDPVLVDIARRPKIVVPDVAFTPRFALEPGERVPLHSAYYLLPRADSPIPAPRLLELLRSPAVAEDLRRRAPTAKSGYRRFRAQALRDVRLPIDPHLVHSMRQPSLLDAA